MVANLYRGRDYVQIWNRDRVLVIHRGSLGHRGIINERVLAPSESEVTAVQQAVLTAEAEGFGALSRSEQSQVLVNFNVSKWEPAEIQSFSMTLQSLLGDILGWTGNGCCDGFTHGREGLTMWCVVADQTLAIPTLIAGLDENHLLHDDDGTAKLAVSDGERYSVVFPEEHRGERLM